MTGQRARRPRESYAERRSRHAEIDDPEVVLAAAFRFLEAQARSVAETRRRLTDTGYRADLIEAAVVRLLAVGLLDDALFSQQWIESRDRARPRGETALKRELRLRGVDTSVIAAALAERRTSVLDLSAGDSDPDESTGPSDPDEVAARRLIERRRRDLDRVVDPRKRRGRAYALLARNGFSPEIASRLSAELVRDEASVDPPS